MNLLDEIRELADKYEREQKAAKLGRVVKIDGGERINFKDMVDDEVFIAGDIAGVRIGRGESDEEGNYVVLDETDVISLIATLERWVNTRSFK